MQLVDYKKPIEWIRAFFDSLKVHQISPKPFHLSVLLESSDNRYLTYPVRGIISVHEATVSCGVNVAVFRCFDEETGTFGAPVEVRNPVFSYKSRG